jgi:hypothetical protein
VYSKSPGPLNFGFQANPNFKLKAGTEHATVGDAASAVLAFTIPNGTDQAAPGARELTARAGLAQARLGGTTWLFGVPPSWQSQPEPPNAAAGSGSSGIRTPDRGESGMRRSVQVSAVSNPVRRGCAAQARGRRFRTTFASRS